MRSGPVLLAFLLAAACTPAAQTPLRAERVVITPDVPGMPMRAAYMTLSNHSDASITITSVSSPQFDDVSIHETTVENEVARMRPLAELVIPSGATIRLEPGGKHLMLSGPTGPGQDAGGAGPRRDVESVPGEVTLHLYSGEHRLLSVAASAMGPAR